MKKTQIKAEIVADSLSPQGDRLTSLLITFPRIILAEVNTHRMLSKNTSSSRAIPFKKMVESVENDPFTPIAWQKSHSGMQGSEYLTGLDRDQCEFEWLTARDSAVEQAQQLDMISTTKQLANRLLEPFMWTTMLITGSKEGWNNFFELRCPQYLLYSEQMPIYFKSKKDLLKYVHEIETDEFKDQYDNLTNLDWLLINEGQAEIHIMDLAEKIYDAMNESKPTQLKSGEWHIPFGENINNDGGKFVKFMMDYTKNRQLHTYPDGTGEVEMTKVKVSTAMAARTSYTVIGDEKEIDYERMIGLHDRLISQDPPHSSPMEHCARAMNMDEYYLFCKGQDGQEDHQHGWCRNYKGFIQYRHLIETKNQ